MTQRDTIFFDQGEVLFTNDWDIDNPEKDQLFYSHYQIQPEVFWQARKIYIDKLFRGLMSEKDYWIKVLDKSQAIHTDPTKAIELARAYQRWKPRMKALVQDLKEKKYRLAIISTTHKEMMDFKIKKFNLHRWFDQIITSNDTHYRKPEPEIYHLALEKMKSTPQSAIFIDDAKANVDGALQVGMQAFVFSDAEQCRSQLKLLGVDVDKSPRSYEANSLRHIMDARV